MQMLYQDFYITEFYIWSNQVVFLSDKYGLINYDESKNILEFKKYKLRVTKDFIEQADDPAKYIKLRIASKENS
jgi:hypothetical protein